MTLDLTLPHMDGIEVCRRIRETSDCYIVIVSARSDEVDKLIGLEVGADDFVLKPFSPREVRARVAALFHHPRSGAGPAEDASVNHSASRAEPVAAGRRADHDQLAGAGLVINSARREVQVDGSIVDLTRIEYDVLEYLATHLFTGLHPRGDGHGDLEQRAHPRPPPGGRARGQPAGRATRALRHHVDPHDPRHRLPNGPRGRWQQQDRRAGGGPYLVARIDSEDWARGLDFSTARTPLPERVRSPRPVGGCCTQNGPREHPLPPSIGSGWLPCPSGDEQGLNPGAVG